MTCLTLQQDIGRQGVIDDYHNIVLPVIKVRDDGHLRNNVDPSVQQANPQHFSVDVHNLDMYLRMGSIIAAYR